MASGKEVSDLLLYYNLENSTVEVNIDEDIRMATPSTTDKVAVIRMIVSDEAGRVSNVFKTMMKKDIEV